MVRRASCSLLTAMVILLSMGGIFILSQGTAADHPVPLHPAAGEPTIPPHIHPSDVPNWVMPAGLFILGLIQLLVGIAIKQTLKQYVMKEECTEMHKDTYHKDIKPLADGAVERREKMRYLETAIHDVAVHADASITQINHRLEMIERNIQRLTFHLLDEKEIIGGD